MSGFLLINKPSGPTSHDIVDQIRRLTGEKRVGHAGTLDPFASGLLVIGVGREATKHLGELSGLDKEYIATIRLGATSDTYDRTGEVRIMNYESGIMEKNIKQILSQFTGKIQQTPPMYSAKKIGGKKLYELARQGKEIARQPQTITMHDLQFIEVKGQMLKVKCKVSSGTYIRSLAHDIGQALGTGALLEELERTAIGPFTLAESQPPQPPLDFFSTTDILNRIKQYKLHWLLS